MVMHREEREVRVSGKPDILLIGPGRAGRSSRTAAGSGRCAGTLFAAGQGSDRAGRCASGNEFQKFPSGHGWVHGERSCMRIWTSAKENSTILFSIENGVNGDGKDEH